MSNQINLVTQVNSASIRKETINGREHWIVPSYTLPSDVVMNGGLYPASEIDAHYLKLEGKLAPLGHPQVNGKFVSASSLEGINLGHIGAANQNVKKVGNRIYSEKRIDIEVCCRTEGGRRLHERLEAIANGESVEPIHTSVALMLEKIPNTDKSKPYDWIARIHDIDHDAILLDEAGAATPEQGVGLMVNTADAQYLPTNVGLLSGITYGMRRDLLRAKIDALLQTKDQYFYIVDFDDNSVAVEIDAVGQASKTKVFGYELKDGKIEITTQGVEVKEQKIWSVVANAFKRVFTPRQVKTDKTGQENVDMTPEEKTALLKEMGEAAANAAKEAVQGVNEKLDTFIANQQAQADAAKAEVEAKEAELRKDVAAVHGDVVANALSGEALAEMHKKLGKAAPIQGNSADVGSGDFAPEFKMPSLGGAK